ncbi:Gfo/Idh/MocA family oxidoreductase [Halorubrum sp. AD140]|uniref:Gfo/Idh/MocA family protein n=1 Tax=Halorubrum sp. AD140 TaxID=3050073 RepID=UPI002ACD0F32|nr:Gfo/Idh/MocA family oxidoreductase [Halorubrum sp. AD140]MDZ5812723.1 Gfo/Idh/MocA family oxidoreductase [Halorubrum sp. AD140]
MAEFDVAFIGTGANPDEPSVDGFAMAYRHAAAYEKLDDCRLVGAADIVRENAEAFAEEYDISADGVFEDYEAMLAELEPDIVSVCTPPATHADLVVGTAESGVVEAIHCEKPMALTWGGARRMARVCEERDVRLTFNHMRRFGKPFRVAKRELDAGAIGDLRRIEYSWGNFYDNGTHAVDMCNYFNDEQPATWVIAQLDYTEEDVRFGTHNENQVLACWEYENGVFGMAATGPAEAVAEGDWRLVGSDGFMDVHLTEKLAVEVFSTHSDACVEHAFEEMVPGETSTIDLAIADVVAALAEGRPSELCAANALNATEIIFAGYESARRRGRVDLPLEVDDNALESMVDDGQLSPAPSDD